MSDKKSEIREEVGGLLEDLRGTLEAIKAAGIQGVTPAGAACKGFDAGAELSNHSPAAEDESATKDSDILFVVGSPFAPSAQGGMAGDDLYAGEAGGLLANMVKAMGYKTNDVRINFALKCAPSGGDSAEEIRSCRPQLLDEIKAASPKVVVALGPVAAEAVLGGGAGSRDVASLRGRMLEFGGWSLMVTWSPVELLQNPALKKDAWEDLKACMRLLGRG